ncbi:hypothetical protein [Symbiopectobacterium purcellii]|uniref:hypothetical protein n=1 Tax=Symbiopectobacterium purcellii TaxID=2871826 RepID=UPI003F83E570
MRIYSIIVIKGLSELFYKKFDGNPDVDVFDHYNEKKLKRRGEYRNALVIGNQTFHEMERSNRLLLANNSDIIVYCIPDFSVGLVYQSW